MARTTLFCLPRVLNACSRRLLYQFFRHRRVPPRGIPQVIVESGYPSLSGLLVRWQLHNGNGFHHKLSATWVVDGFGLKAVNWLRQVIRHNGAAIDICSQDDKRLTRLICSIDKSTFTCNPALVHRVKTRLSAIKASHKPCKRLPHPWQLLSTGDPRPPDVALGCTPS